MATVQDVIAPLPSVTEPVQLSSEVARRRNSYSANDLEPRPTPTFEYHECDNMTVIYEKSKSQHGDYRFYPLPGHSDTTESHLATRPRRASITFGKPSFQQASSDSTSLEPMIVTDPIFDTPHPTRKCDKIWYEDQSATLSHAEVYDITNPPEWFSDNVMGMSLSFLSRILSCPEHKIWLCDPNSANQIWKYQHIMEQGNECPELDRVIETKMAGMEYLFIPVSDGYLKQYEIGKEVERKEDQLQKLEKECQLSREEIIQQVPELDPHSEGGEKVRTTGSHWSLVIIDLRNANQLHATYFDSWIAGGYKDNVGIKETIVNGINTILFPSSKQVRAPPSSTVATSVPN